MNSQQSGLMWWVKHRWVNKKAGWAEVLKIFTDFLTPPFQQDIKTPILHFKIHFIFTVFTVCELEL